MNREDPVRLFSIAARKWWYFSAICFLLGENLVLFAMERHALLSSFTSQWISGVWTKISSVQDYVPFTRKYMFGVIYICKVPTSCEVCIYKALKISSRIRLKSQTKFCSSFQILSNSLNCPVMTKFGIIAEPRTLVNQLYAACFRPYRFFLSFKNHWYVRPYYALWNHMVSPYTHLCLICLWEC